MQEHQNLKDQETKQADRIKLVWLALTCSVLITMTLTVSALLVPTWFSFKKLQQTHGLDRYKVTSYSWRFIWDEYCNNDDSKKWCDDGNVCKCSDIQRIKFADEVYFACDIFSLIFMWLWLVKLFNLLVEAEQKRWYWLGYVFSIGTWVFHLVAFVTYVSLLHLEFVRQHCDSAWGENEEVYCAEDGPKVAITVLVLMSIQVCVFVFYFFRHIRKIKIMRKAEL